METRRETYFKLSTRLALLDDPKLRALFGKSPATRGWGKNQVVTVDGIRVFTKTIPITDLEYAHPYSTRNLYDLPCFYNYGVGSAGFGAFREIATHTKTTNWVLSGARENFPLTYHWRILPVTDPPPAVDPKQLEGYVRYWGGSESVRRYMLDRLAARHEAVLFLEYIPHVLHDWLGDHMDRFEILTSQMLETLHFIAGNDLIHFDAHAANILTDGETFFLADYGLVLDLEFDLTPIEQEFFSRHRHYDYGEFFTILLDPLQRAAANLDTVTRDALTKRYGDIELITLLRNVEEVSANGEIELATGQVAALILYRDVISLMNRFFTGLRASERKDSTYDDAALLRLLEKIPGF